MIGEQYEEDLTESVPELIEYATRLEEILNILCDGLKQFGHENASEEYIEKYDENKFVIRGILQSILNIWISVDGINSEPRFIEFSVAMFKRINEDYAGFTRPQELFYNGKLSEFAESLIFGDDIGVKRMSDYIRKFEPEYVSPVENMLEIAKANYKKEQEENKQTTADESKKGCYVATAVYGSYDCPEVWTLRRFRDNTLESTWYGRAFIKTYYAVSPTLVKLFGKTEWFNKLFKGFLDRLVNKLRANGVEDLPYKD